MLDKKEIKHIANLARIEIDEKEEKKFGKELSEILVFMESLNKLDTKEIKSLTGEVVARNITRSDTQIDRDLEGKRKELLASAPETQNDFIKVKAVFD